MNQIKVPRLIQKLEKGEQVGGTLNDFLDVLCHMLHLLLYKSIKSSVAEWVAAPFALSRLQLQVVGSDPGARFVFCRRSPVDGALQFSSISACVGASSCVHGRAHVRIEG